MAKLLSYIYVHGCEQVFCKILKKGEMLYGKKTGKPEQEKF